MTRRGGRVCIPTDYVSKKQLDRQTDRLDGRIDHQKQRVIDLKAMVSHLQVAIQRLAVVPIPDEDE